MVVTGHRASPRSSAWAQGSFLKSLGEMLLKTVSSESADSPRFLRGSGAVGFYVNSASCGLAVGAYYAQEAVFVRLGGAGFFIVLSSGIHPALPLPSELHFCVSRGIIWSFFY